MGSTGGAPVHAPEQRSWRDVGGCGAWLVLIVLVAGVLQLAGASTGFAYDVEVSPPIANVLPPEQAPSDQLTSASLRSTTAAPARYTYDAATVARSAAHEIIAAEVDSTRLSDVLEGSAPPSVVVRGTSTTPGLRFVAPNSARPSASSVIDDVMAETRAGAGNLTSKYSLTADEALTAGERWVGSGYTELGKPGSGVFRSADGTRQFRIDNGSITGAHSPGVPHVHLETISPGSKVPVANNHIPFTE